MKIRNKVFAVTGAGSGIGRELTLQLIAQGAKVAAIDYNAEALKQTQALVVKDYQGPLKAADRISCHTVDVSNRKQVAALPQAIVDKHGQIDGLINNAGIIQPFIQAEDLPLEQIERLFNINWWGVVYMVKAFLPLLRQRPEAHILNVSSMGGYMPFPGQVSYGASKAAVKLLTEGLMVELSQSSVGVTLAYPGAVQTNITDNAPDISDSDKSRMRSQSKGKSVGVTAAKAAATMIAAIEKNKARVLIGNDCKVIDKLYRLMPVKTAHLMAWLMKKFVGADLPALAKQ